MEKDKRVDLYLKAKSDKQDLLKILRELLLSTELVETLKWGIPVYMWNGKNVVGIAAFQHHTALWFFQGALLKDEQGVLVNAQEGKTQAMRQWHFRKAEEINPHLIKAYLEEAIAHYKAGNQVKNTRNKELILPEELKVAMEENPPLDTAFAQLSPGRQREYAAHIAEAKQAKTRVTRLEKCIPLILERKGLNDKYK